MQLKRGLCMKNFKAPEFEADAFNCPYCGAFSNMIWYSIIQEMPTSYKYFPFDKSFLSECSCCEKYMLWVEGEMIIPSNSTAPMPHCDMPDDIKKIYTEARDIINKSPRGAAALLRLALQMLCDYLVPENGNINDKISKMVSNGLPKSLQKAFDLVRIIGNNAVHPGVINIQDNPAIAYKMFELLNMIVEKMITEPKEIESFYNDTIPENQKQAIDKRDSAFKK